MEGTWGTYRTEKKEKRRPRFSVPKKKRQFLRNKKGKQAHSNAGRLAPQRRKEGVPYAGLGEGRGIGLYYSDKEENNRKTT